MKIFYYILLIFIAIAIHACGDKDENNAPYEDVFDEIQEEDPDIAQLVEDNITVKASYSQYIWHFEIKSTLHRALPDSDIKFGIGHGDYKGKTNVSIENDAYSYSSSTSGSYRIFKFDNPYWYYFLLGPGQGEGTVCDFYYRQIQALLAKQKVEKLSSSEIALMEDCIDELNKEERKANTNYHPSIYVKVDGRFYEVAEFSRY